METLERTIICEECLRLRDEVTHLREEIAKLTAPEGMRSAYVFGEHLMNALQTVILSFSLRPNFAA